MGSTWGQPRVNLHGPTTASESGQHSATSSYSPASMQNGFVSTSMVLT